MTGRLIIIVLNWIFRVLAGLDKIEYLQNHESQEIYQKAFDIIERYFGTEEEDQNIAPAVSGDQMQQFEFGTSSGAAGLNAETSFEFWQ